MARKDSKNPEEFEQNEFQKFCRFFCVRFVQAVVHARMDVPMDQPCVANPETNDWFNFKQDEFGEVSAYLKTTIKTYPPTVPAMTVDFFLHTASGDNLPLESWVVRVDPSEVDPNVNLFTVLYHQLGFLLRSVCAAARVTPAARQYVRNQGDKTFVLCYRVCVEEPDLDLLGEDRKSMRLGSCPSAFGSVQVDLHYRTKMELSLPHPDEEHQHDLSHDEPRQGGIFVKASIPIRKSTELKRRLVLSNESKPKAKNWFSPLAEELPFTGDMSRCRNASQSSQGSDLYIPAIYSNLSAELLAAMPEDIKAPKVSESDGTPKSSEPPKKDFPFCSLVMTPESEPKTFEEQSLTSSSSGSKRYDSETTTTTSSASSSLRELARAKHRRQNDLFGFLEDEEDLPSSQGAVHPTVLPAFTDPEDMGKDINSFFNQLTLAPNTIKSFEADETKWLQDQLDHFKQKLPEFDNFVQSMKT